MGHVVIQVILKFSLQCMCEHHTYVKSNAHTQDLQVAVFVPQALKLTK